MKKGWLRHLDFIFVDIVGIEISLAAVYFLLSCTNKATPASFYHMVFLIPIFHLLISLMTDTYNGILQRGYLKELGALLRLEFMVFFLLMLLFYFFEALPAIPQKTLIAYFGFCIPITYLLRFNHKFYLHRRYSNIKYARQIVVATNRKAAEQMIHTITESAIRNYQFFGLVILDQSMVGEKINNVTVSADKDSMMSYVKDHVVDEVFINLPDESEETLLLARQLLDAGVTVHIYMEEAYRSLPNRSMGNVFGYNVLTTTISPISFRQSLGKRLMDIAGGVIGCLITAILTVIIGPIIFIKSPGPIFFSQIRVGKRGREFKIYKFRSMYMDAEERKKELMEQNKIGSGLMFKINDDPRIIKGIGNFIRKTSLDEFPQFWNVLKGDMSMVGTRPPTVDEYARYSPHHKRRLTMLPGITGLWQVSGRSEITDFEEVVRLDTEYIENWSLDQDVKIILKTIQQVVKHEDAY